MNVYEEIITLADQLSKSQKAQLIEHLSEELKRDAEGRVPWREFLRQTYGSLKDTPIQRWEQGEYEERERLE
jgi:hypothetical protein